MSNEEILHDELCVWKSSESTLNPNLAEIYLKLYNQDEFKFIFPYLVVKVDKVKESHIYIILLIMQTCVCASYLYANVRIAYGLVWSTLWIAFQQEFPLWWKYRESNPNLRDYFEQ